MKKWTVRIGKLDDNKKVIETRTLNYPAETKKAAIDEVKNIYGNGPGYKVLSSY